MAGASEARVEALLSLVGGVAAEVDEARTRLCEEVAITAALHHDLEQLRCEKDSEYETRRTSSRRNTMKDDTSSNHNNCNTMSHQEEPDLQPAMLSAAECGVDGTLDSLPEMSGTASSAGGGTSAHPCLGEQMSPTGFSSRAIEHPQCASTDCVTSSSPSGITSYGSSLSCEVDHRSNSSRAFRDPINFEVRGRQDAKNNAPEESVYAAAANTDLAGVTINGIHTGEINDTSGNMKAVTDSTSEEAAKDIEERCAHPDCRDVLYGARTTYAASMCSSHSALIHHRVTMLIF